MYEMISVQKNKRKPLAFHGGFEKRKRNFRLIEQGFATADLPKRYDKEPIDVKESIEWLQNNYSNKHMSKLCNYFKTNIIQTEPNHTKYFLDASLAEKHDKLSSVLDILDGHKKRAARNRSNAFEGINHSIFINRDGVKMANIDSALDFMFTMPSFPGYNADEPLYYVDINGGAGGYVEYLLWRNQKNAKVFGYSPSIAYSPNEFVSGNAKAFDIYRNVDNKPVTDADLINSFTSYVLKKTDIGAHYMIASSRGISAHFIADQEDYNKQLFLCECILALNILRPGGHLLIQFFGAHTVFTIGILYIMYYCFDEITIFKPKSTRPGNGERYLLCKGKKDAGPINIIRKYLLTVNEKMTALDADKYELNEVMPLEVILDDTVFCDFIRKSNNDIATNKILNLEKMIHYYNNPWLVEARQPQIKEECMIEWQLPNVERKTNGYFQVHNFLPDIIGDWDNYKQFLYNRKPEVQLMRNTLLDEIFASFPSWHFVACENYQRQEGSRGLYLCSGKKFMHQFDSVKKNWQRLPVHYTVNLTPKTLVYGEFCLEYSQGRMGRKAFHIIDAIMIDGVDLRAMSLTKRHEICDNYAKGMEEEAGKVPIRCKRLYHISEFTKLFNEMDLVNGNRRLRIGGSGVKTFYSAPNCIVFLSDLNSNYLKVYSKTWKTYYFFDKTSKESFFPQTKELKCHADFKETFENRCVWDFNSSAPNCPLMNHQTLLRFILSKLNM